MTLPCRCSIFQKDVGSPSRARTCDNSINSRMLYQLSYRGPVPRCDERAYSKASSDCKAQKAGLGRLYPVQGIIFGSVRAFALPTSPTLAKTRPSRATLLAAVIRGLVAEWLRRGLQILAPRFDSGRGLQILSYFGNVSWLVLDPGPAKPDL